MQIDSEFTVNAPIQHVWEFLLDVERLAPCAPGAELTEVVDDRTWKGKVNIKVGPVGMSFAGTVVMQERDDAAHRVVLKAQGMEQRGKGAATAVVQGHLEEADAGTKVSMQTDLTITGAAAQYGRGMIQDISQRMTKDFARCLEANMAVPSGSPPAEAEAAPVASPGPEEGAATAASSEAPAVVPSARPDSPGGQPRPAGKPVKGLRLALWALWRAVVRFFRRLFRMRRR